MGKVTRRLFLGLGVAAVGGLAVGAYYVRRDPANPLTAEAGETVFDPWIKIGEDGRVTVIVPRAELGQGVTTTLPALVAEELRVPLDAIDVEHGPPAAAYYNAALLKKAPPYAEFEDGTAPEAMRAVAAVGAKLLGAQVTGGSTSVMDAYDGMRRSGAAARAQLVAAAAARWGVPAERLVAENGAVDDPDTGERLSYGELAAAAGALPAPAPEAVVLRDPADWTILGKSQPRRDAHAKSTGAPIYGIDVELPEMLHATPVMPRVFGARAASADRDAALAVPGVVKVVPLKWLTGEGFAVVATSTWAAFKGAEALAPEWTATDAPADEAAQRAALGRALDEGSPAAFEMGGRGDPDSAFDSAPADEILEVEYRVPFQAHAAMEPLAATARLRGGRLELWTATQAPTFVQGFAADAVGLDSDDVTVHALPAGGSFGRRGESDFAVYAALLSRETDGRPVKVTWRREEDAGRDMYRPMATARLRVHARPAEGVIAMEGRVAAPAVFPSVASRSFPGLPAGPDKSTLEGLFDQPYAVAHSVWRGIPTDLGVPVSFWRSVGHSQNAFFHESALDEAAARIGMDPLELRLRLVDGDPRFAPARAALERVAEMSGWGSPAEGRAQGLAFHLSFGCWTAMVAEVSGDADAVKVERLLIAADVGRVLDPANLAAQLEGGAIFGLSAAMRQAITFEGGRVRETNFDSYDALRLAETPPIEVALLETAPHIGGAGEPGVPPVAPALGAAIARLTGTRVRELPFARHVRFA